MRVGSLLPRFWEVGDGVLRDVREREGFVDAVEVLFVPLFEEEEEARIAHHAGANIAFVESAELLDDTDDPAVVLAHALVELAGDAVAIRDGEEGAEFFQDDAFALGTWFCHDFGAGANTAAFIFAGSRSVD
jgi:hypothetical protein